MDVKKQTVTIKFNSSCQAVDDCSSQSVVQDVSLNFSSSANELSCRGQSASALRAPPDPAPRLLTPQVGACTNLNVQVPAALSLTPLGAPRRVKGACTEERETSDTIRFQMDRS